MSKIRRERFNNFTMDMDTKSPAETIKVISQINRNRGRQTFALSNSDAAMDLAAEHFENMTTNNHPPATAFSTSRRQETRQLDRVAETIFSRNKYAEIITEMSNTTAPGITKISNVMIKEGGPQLREVILKLFRVLFVSGRVPGSWKKSLICPVPKKGDLNLICNYRPISLTETLRKIFEKFLVQDIIAEIEPMHAGQGGFRADHCCNDMIICLDNIIKSSTTPVQMAFLDIKAAYDSVDRSILWRRCISAGMNKWCIKILKSLFDHNTAQVVIGQKKSKSFRIKNGVLQGSVLSPLLYSIFINTLPKALESGPKVTVGRAGVNCILYADDIALVASTAADLQLLLKMCEEHAKRNRYAFNVGKCNVIADAHGTYKIGTESLPRTETFTYLGVEINQTGIAADKFLARRVAETLKTAGNLRMMGMNVGGFSIASAARIYKAFVRSKLEASMCIIQHTPRTIKALEHTQQAIISKIAHTSHNTSATILRSIFGMPKMQWRIKWLKTSYWYRYQSLPATHLIKLMDIPDQLLQQGTYPDEESQRQILSALPPTDQKIIMMKGKKDLLKAEMTNVNDETKKVTAGHLDLQKYNFQKTFMHPTDRKIIVHWILKKYPARSPPKCGNCLFGTATQTHIANCSNLLKDLFPNVPARWKVEHAISLPLKPTHLRMIAETLRTAIEKCLVYMR